MAGDRSGLKTLSLTTARRLLRKERSDQRDVYQNLSHVSLELADELAEAHNRFQIDLRARDCRGPLSFSPQSIAQLCKITGIPVYAIERMPGSVGLSVLRCMLEIAGHSIDRLFLFRLKETPTMRRVRAILPASYIRCDDLEILEMVTSTVGAKGARVSNLTIQDDLFSLRLVLPDRVDFGTPQAPDAAQVGVDLTTSETGFLSTEVRYLVYRLICSNGMTSVAKEGKEKVRRTPRMDPEAFRGRFQYALSRTLPHGRTMARRLVGARHDYVRDPVSELGEVLQNYGLGSPRGKLGRWVLTELLKEQNLMGVRRFDVVQAFTSVAKQLEHRDRLRVEDAMTEYLLETV